MDYGCHGVGQRGMTPIDRMSSTLGFGLAIAALAWPAGAGSSPGTGLAADAGHSSSARARIVIRRDVSTGRPVSMTGTGLNPGFHMSLLLSPARSGNCCGIRIGRTRVVPASGQLRYRFRWPRSYYACSGAANCRRSRRWLNGERARVSLGAPEIDPRTQSNAYAGATVVVHTR